MLMIFPADTFDACDKPNNIRENRSSPPLLIIPIGNVNKIDANVSKSAAIPKNVQNQMPYAGGVGANQGTPAQK